jgi:hypothetical protein
MTRPQETRTRHQLVETQIEGAAPLDNARHRLGAGLDTWADHASASSASATTAGCCVSRPP